MYVALEGGNKDAAGESVGVRLTTLWPAERGGTWRDTAQSRSRFLDAVAVLGKGCNSALECGSVPVFKSSHHQKSHENVSNLREYASSGLLRLLSVCCGKGRRVHGTREYGVRCKAFRGGPLTFVHAHLDGPSFLLCTSGLVTSCATF